MKRWTIVFAVAVVAAAMPLPLSVQAQTVNRVVSQYFRWDQSQSNTPNTAKKVIYSHTFFVPSLSTGAPKYNVAYLSVHLVGDANCSGTNCEVQEGLACTLDGTANVNTELMPNKRTIARAVRRGDAARPRVNRVGRGTTGPVEKDMRTAYSGGVRGYSGDVATVGWGLGYVRGAFVRSPGVPRYRAVRSGAG